MKQKIFLILHVVLTAGAAALTAISSAMAYPLGNMGAIIFMSGAAILLDLLLMLRKRRHSAGCSTAVECGADDAVLLPCADRACGFNGLCLVL